MSSYGVDNATGTNRPIYHLNEEVRRLNEDTFHPPLPSGNATSLNDGNRSIVAELQAEIAHLRNELAKSKLGINHRSNTTELFGQVFLYNKTAGCRIIPPLQFVDCGCEGHLFKADMVCPYEKKGKVKGSRVQAVAVKFFTKTAANQTTEYMPMMTTDRLRVDQQLHDVLFAVEGKEELKNNMYSPIDNEEWVKKVFTVGLGLATIPKIMLQEQKGTKESPKDCLCSGGDKLVLDFPPDSPTSYMSVMGKVMIYHEQIRVHEATVRVRKANIQKLYFLSAILILKSISCDIIDDAQVVCLRATGICQTAHTNVLLFIPPKCPSL
jgi:hypothetical protein